MSELRKIAAILVSDVVGYSRLAEADEDRTLSRLADCAATWSTLAIAAGGQTSEIRDRLDYKETGM